jgi:hypothetical protein
MAGMEVRLGQRKLVQHDEDPGHVRELTFSGYRRMPLLGPPICLAKWLIGPILD